MSDPADLIDGSEQKDPEQKDPEQKYHPEQKQQKKVVILKLSEEEMKEIIEKGASLGIEIDQDGFAMVKSDYVCNHQKYAIMMYIGQICKSYRIFVGDQFGVYLFVCDTIYEIMNIVRFYAENVHGVGGSFQRLEDLQEGKVPDEFKELEDKYDFFKNTRRKIRPPIPLYRINYEKSGLPEGVEIVKAAKELFQKYNDLKEKCKKLEAQKLKLLRITDTTKVDTFEFDMEELESVETDEIKIQDNHEPETLQKILDDLETQLNETRKEKDEIHTKWFDIDQKLEDLWDQYVDKNISPNLKEIFDQFQEGVSVMVFRNIMEELARLLNQQPE